MTAAYFCYDEIGESPAMIGAHLASLKYLAPSSTPHWIVSSHSTGTNLFGRTIPKMGVAIGWCAVAGRESNTHLKAFSDASAFPRGLAEAVGNRLRLNLASQLQNAAYVSLLSLSRRLCHPDLVVPDILYGPDSSLLVDAILTLHETPNRFLDLHAAVMRTMTVNPQTYTSIEPDLARPSWDSSKPRVMVKCIDVERPYSDTVYTIAVAALSIGEFIGVSRKLGVLTAEFRRRLYSRGGIYGAGLSLGFCERTVSFWTTHDRYPRSTYDLICQLLSTAQSEIGQSCHRETALAYLPIPPPAWTASESAQGSITGVTPIDRDALVQEPEVSLDWNLWTVPESNHVYCVCGPSERMEEIRRTFG